MSYDILKGGMIMNRQTAEKIISIQEQLVECAEYRALLEEYHNRNEKLMKLLEELDEKHAAVLWDSLGVSIELHLMMLAQAIEME